LYDAYAVPCADRVLFEGAFENFVPHSPAHIDVKADRPPILLIAGGADHLVTPEYTAANFRLIDQSPAMTGFKEFPGRPHFTGQSPAGKASRTLRSTGRLRQHLSHPWVNRRLL
jgi:hypothetical protein